MHFDSAVPGTIFARQSRERHRSGRALRNLLQSVRRRRLGHSQGDERLAGRRRRARAERRRRRVERLSSRQRLRVGRPLPGGRAEQVRRTRRQDLAVPRTGDSADPRRTRYPYPRRDGLRQTGAGGC